MIAWLVALVLLVVYTVGSSLPMVAESAITSRLRGQLSQVDGLDVRVLANPPVRALGGHVDAVHISARSLMVEGLSLATASFETGPVDIAPWSLIVGPPRLLDALQGTASADVPEASLLQLAHSERVQRQLKGIPIQISILPGFPPITQQVDLRIDGLRVRTGELGVDGAILMAGNALPFTASASPQLVAPNVVALKSLQAAVMGRSLPPSTLAQATSRSFELPANQPDGSRVELTELALDPGRIHLGARLMVPPDALNSR